MAQLLKFDEWQASSGSWYVADVHTWTGWRAAANVLGVGEDMDKFIAFLGNKYSATVCSYNKEKDFLLFNWKENQHKQAHQFKLDVNRIARKKNYQVEKKF